MELFDSIKMKTLMPYIAVSDIILTGKDNYIIGLNYDEGNMFVPIIILMEQANIQTLKETASELGIPVLKNDELVKNLCSSGKVGEIIPELYYREIAAIVSRYNRNHKQILTKKSDQGMKKTLKPPRPIKIEMSESLINFLEKLDSFSIIENGLKHIQQYLSQLFGYNFPLIKTSLNKILKGGEYRILFKGIEVRRASISLDWFETFDLGFDPDKIQIAAKAVAKSLVNHAENLIQKRMCELLGRDEVQAILDRAEEKYPVVTSEVKSFFSLGSIRDILRGLLSEQVSIRYIPVILETLADWGNFGPAPNEMIIEHIRQSLKQQICMEYTDDKQTLRVLTLDAVLEEKLSNNGIKNSEWLDVFTPGIQHMEEKGFKPVILCSPIVRSLVKEFTRLKFPNLAVLSYVEIPSDIKVEPIGEVTLKSKHRKAPLEAETGS